MNVLLEKPPVEVGSAGATPRRGWLFWSVLVLLGYLLFAHIGCHGDEDNELFTPWFTSAQTAQP